MILKRALNSALYHTRNVKAYVMIIRHVYENHDRRETIPNEMEESRLDFIGDKEDVVGALILDLASKSRQFAEVAHDVLAALVEQGWQFSIQIFFEHSLVCEYLCCHINKSLSLLKNQMKKSVCYSVTSPSCLK